MVFTSDEAWENIPGQTVVIGSHRRISGGRGSSADGRAAQLDWERIFAIRDEVLKALEEARIAKQIGSSLEAKVILTADDGTTRFLLDYFEQLRYIFIVSQVEVHEGDALKVEIQKADGQKCERCWNYSVRVGEFDKLPDRLRTLHRGVDRDRKSGRSVTREPSGRLSCLAPG